MNEQKNNGKGIFYGVIGIATLVVAIVGATFAYFTASSSVNNAFAGDMATITFEVVVDKQTDVDEDKGGLIPMSNSMVEAAVSNSEPCVDDNGNAVCQIYKITASNTGSASLFLDGYVTLSGGSGIAADHTNTNNQTTMRWAQVFTNGDTYTTVGNTTTGARGVVANPVPEASKVAGIDKAWATLDAPDTTVGDVKTTYSHNTNNIKTAFADVTTRAYIFDTQYDVIDVNYIRVSDHADGTYTRTADVTSALVFNQYLDAAGGANPSEDLYIVVWLTETGKDQTADADEEGAFDSVDTNANDKIDANEVGLDFFEGSVVFNSAQGSEVTATFAGFVAVRSDKAGAQ